MAKDCVTSSFWVMNRQLLTIISAVLLLSGLSASAQAKLQLLFSGTCYTTDAQGRIVAQSINNQTLLQKAAQAGGLKDTSGLALAYHINGNELGDTIEVINRNSGDTLTTVFGLYFGESFGRQALLSASHRQMKRIEYIYTDQNSHSLGSAFLTDYYFLDNNGNTNTTYVLGQMQYLILSGGSQTNAQVCTASFTTLRPWKFQ
jgi:hypothetical protein